MYKLHVLEQSLDVQEQLVADGTGARTRPTHEGRMLLQDAQVKLQFLCGVVVVVRRGEGRRVITGGNQPGISQLRI